jgi:hypothetical protein
VNAETSKLLQTQFSDETAFYEHLLRIIKFGTEWANANVSALEEPIFWETHNLGKGSKNAKLNFFCSQASSFFLKVYETPPKETIKLIRLLAKIILGEDLDPDTVKKALRPRGTK